MLCTALTKTPASCVATKSLPYSGHSAGTFTALCFPVLSSTVVCSPGTQPPAAVHHKQQSAAPSSPCSCSPPGQKQTSIASFSPSLPQPVLQHTPVLDMVHMVNRLGYSASCPDPRSCPPAPPATAAPPPLPLLPCPCPPCPALGTAEPFFLGNGGSFLGARASTSPRLMPSNADCSAACRRSFASSAALRPGCCCWRCRHTSANADSAPASAACGLAVQPVIGVRRECDGS